MPCLRHPSTHRPLSLQLSSLTLGLPPRSTLASTLTSLRMALPRLRTTLMQHRPSAQPSSGRLQVSPQGRLLKALLPRPLPHQTRLRRGNLQLRVGQSGLALLRMPLEVRCWLELQREEHIMLGII